MKAYTFIIVSVMLLPIFRLVAQPVNTTINDVAMPAPNAASLGKYGDIPVSYFTGVPNISVPIYTMQDGPLALSVSLSYHSSGIKVGETASWVGLGWNLNAGGMITRSTLGTPDEKGAGYLNAGKDLKYPITKSYTGYPTTWPYNGTYQTDLPLMNQQMEDIAEGNLDGEPDLFSFNFEGYSGKFFFDKDKKINIIPKSDVKIEYSINNTGAGGTPEIYRFIITTPDGTRYIFGTLEGEAATSYSGVEFSYYTNIQNSAIAPTSWYLRRIESADKKYNITLTYTNENYSYKNLGSCTVTWGAQGQSSPVNCGPIGIGLNTSVNINDIQGKRLSQISGSTGTTQIDFIATTERQDLDTYTGSSSRKQLDAIEIKTPSNSNYCKKFFFTYDYFVSSGGSTSEYKRLRLNQVQEKSCDGTTIVIPAYKFTYNSGTLPHRFSKAIDHWGYYNGVTSNENKLGIPSGTSIAWLGQVITPPYANSDRESSESNMLIGALKKIEYPTGGSTEFTYEANDYYQTTTITAPTTIFGDISNCTYPQTACCSTTQASGSKTFTSDELTDAQFRLTLYNLNISPYQYCNIGNPNPPSPSVQVIAKETVSNIGVGSYSFNITNSQPSVEMVKPLSQLGTFQAGVSYTFTVYVFHGKGAFNIFKNGTVIIPSNKKVGGLRIKEIKTYDGISSANDIIKRYKYTNVGTTNSSGKLYQMPEYVGYQQAWDGSILGITFHATSVVPLTSANGYHIGYNRVEEEHVGNGKSVFIFYNEFNSQQIQQTYPAVPEQARVKDGHQDVSEIYNLTGTKLGNTKNIINSNDNYTYTPGIMYRAYKFQFWDAATSSYLDYYYAKPFSLRTAPFRLMEQQSTIDGITTTTTYEYDSQNRHLAPTAIAMTNSDGKIHNTQYKYVFDWPANDVRTYMIDKNIIGTPVETNFRLDGILMSGTRTEYSFFDSSGLPTSTTGSNHPYPYKFWNYEKTWDGSGFPILGSLDGWVLQGTINEYHPDASTGKWYPKKFTKTSWQSETYDWNKGLITKRKFNDFEWNYAYHTNTRLLSSITDIDGQVVNFTYDKLMRLQTTSARGGNVATNFTYFYKGTSSTNNYIESITTFTAASGSSLTQKGTREYLDGLGRPMQTLQRQHHPTKGTNGATYSAVDVITNYEYDNQGRLIKTTRPYQGYLDGTYFAPPGGTAFTLTQYEASPLNRVTSVTPPNGYATTTTYGKNTSTITVPGGTSYSANTLYETKVTDPDDRVVYSYKDKKGRVILTKQTNTAGTSPAETYNVYDDKDRLTTVVPPGATLSSTELIYKYLYSPDDLVTMKKVPGAAAVNLKYNNRDLLVFLQDGNLSAQSKCVGTKYDSYGRPTETGFVSGFPDPNTIFSFSESLTKNFYDGYDGTTQLNLTTYPQYRSRVRRGEVKVLGSSSTFLHTTFTYDTHGRVTNAAGNNYLNTGSATAESVAFTYDWADNKLTDNRTHTPGSGAATSAQTVNFQWQYDNAGRAINYLLNLNGDNTHLAEYNYSLYDELIERNLAANFVSGSWAWLQSVDYTYNNMGWLTAINSSSHTGTAQAFPTGCSPALPNPGATTRTLYPETSDVLYLELRYDQLFSSGSGGISGMTGTIQKAGNISQIAWRTRGRDRQTYSFTYDHLSRLSTSTYYDVNNAGTASTTNRYNENLTYDIRGNISTLQRQGYYSSSCNYGQIDNLSYTYTPSTNRIASITDSAPASQKSHGFNPGSGGAGYTYDANGNLKTDSYKGISNITYNHLNLPSVITYSNGNSIEFVYDAAGMKLRKIVKVGATVQYEQSYLGGLEYRKNGTGSTRIEAVYHSEGRYLNLNAEVNNTLLWRKEYTLKDHLGNARITFTDKNGNGIVDVTNSASTNDIIQENHYYPFGLSYEGPWLMNDAARDNKYQYNGKEWNDDFGLNWNDYGARWYMPDIGRWGQIDPMAEKYAMWSPYNYVYNSPLRYIDPSGENAELIYDKKNKMVTIKMDLYFHGSGMNENFDAQGWASSIQNQWNEGAKGATVSIDGEDYTINFEIIGKTTDNIGKLKQLIEGQKKFGDGTAWARANFIQVGEGLPNETTSSNEATLNLNSDITSRTHEIGHLLGLRHPGDPARDFPIEGQPGIMSTIFNSVEAQYSVDGKSTKWEYRDGQPYIPREGALDVTKRRVLQSEVQSVASPGRARGHRFNRAYTLGVFK